MTLLHSINYTYTHPILHVPCWSCPPDAGPSCQRRADSDCLHSCSMLWTAAAWTLRWLSASMEGWELRAAGGEPVHVCVCVCVCVCVMHTVSISWLKWDSHLRTLQLQYKLSKQHIDISLCTPKGVYTEDLQKNRSTIDTLGTVQ